MARLHRIEDYAREAPKSAERRIATLAEYLTRNCRSDEQRALAIYAWITSHIDYDEYGADHDEALTGQDAETVLALHKGVCAGYANLFVDLAEASGVPAVYVSGYAKSWDKILVTEDDRHAWNAVYWNHQWHLIDSTWGEDYLEETRRVYPPQYFDVKPEEMLASHFPADAQWQLRTRPAMTRKEFDNQCLREPEFFDMGLELMDTKLYKMAFDRECIVRLKASPELLLEASLESNGKELPGGSVLLSRRGDLRALEVRPPKAGRYTLAVWAGRPDAENWTHVLTYHLESRLSPSSQPAYPATEFKYQQQEVLLQEPLEGSLTPGRHHFRLTCPNAIGVYVYSGHKVTYLKREGVEFEGDCSVEGDQAVIVMVPGDSGLSQWFNLAREPLLRYEVRAGSVESAGP